MGDGPEPPAAVTAKPKPRFCRITPVPGATTPDPNRSNRLCTNETAMPSSSTAQRYTVPPAGSNTSCEGSCTRRAIASGSISPRTSAPSRTSRKASSSASRQHSIRSTSAPSVRSSSASPSSAAIPCVGGGSSTTVSLLKSTASGSVTRARKSDRSSSVSQLAAQIAAADGAAVEARRSLPSDRGERPPESGSRIRLPDRGRGAVAVGLRAARPPTRRRSADRPRIPRPRARSRPAGMSPVPAGRTAAPAVPTRRPRRGPSPTSARSGPGPLRRRHPETGPAASIPSARPPANTSANRSPPGPVAIGSDTHRTAAAATAASTALPPSRRMWSPAAVAVGWLDATIALAATAGGRAAITAPAGGLRPPPGPSIR